MRVVGIFVILIKVSSLDKFILGAQVKVPEFAGRPVLGAVRLDKDRRRTFTQAKANLQAWGGGE